MTILSVIDGMSYVNMYYEKPISRGSSLALTVEGRM